jgi:hypothetical protein
MRNICISYEQHKFFTKRLNEDEKEELMAILINTGHGFQIPWVVNSISKSQSYSESRAKNRRGKNKETYDEDMKTYDEHMESNSNSNSIEDNKGVKGEKKEGEIFHLRINETFKNIDVLASDALADRLNFVEHVMRQNKVTELQLSAAIYAFVSFLKSGGETVKTSKDFRFHFQNWLKKQDKTLFRINNPVNGKPLTNIPNAKDIAEKYK